MARKVNMKCGTCGCDFTARFKGKRRFCSPTCKNVTKTGKDKRLTQKGKEL